MKKYVPYIMLVAVAATVISWKTAKFYDEAKDMSTVSKVFAKYALDEHPAVMADTSLIGIWKMDADTDPHNYFVLERFDQNKYVFTYMNNEGSNRTFENVSAFFSNVGDTKFLNVRFFDWNPKHDGYFFLKVTDIDPRGFHMTMELVADTTLQNINSASEVRARIAKNINTPGYFKKAVHFRKILPLMYCK